MLKCHFKLLKLGFKSYTCSAKLSDFYFLMLQDLISNEVGWAFMQYHMLLNALTQVHTHSVRACCSEEREQPCYNPEWRCCLASLTI